MDAIEPGAYDKLLCTSRIHAENPVVPVQLIVDHSLAVEHHGFEANAFEETAAVAIGTAAAIPGTLVNLAASGGERESVCFGHPSGTLRVGAQARQVDCEWKVTKAIMSRSARILMQGAVLVPGDSL